MAATLSRMTARSVVLSVLLGAHPAWATASELIRLTEDFDIKEATLRVALTRMVSAGDLVRSEDGYRLSDRLLARQRRQDDAINPQLRSWDGTWTTLVITSVGIDARTRAALRTTLQQNRFGELREGVWLRPDNLKLDPAARRAVAGARAARVRRQPRRTGRPTVGSSGAGRAPAGNCSTTCPPPPTSRADSSRPQGWCATCSPIPCCPTSCCPTVGPVPRCGSPMHNSPPSWRPDETKPNLSEAK